MDLNKMNRRRLMQAALGIVGLAAVEALGSETRAKKPAAGGAAKGGGDLDLPMLDPKTDAMAKNVNYAVKHSDVTKADIKVEKQGVKFEQQFCSNCMLYTAVGEKGGKKVGKCTLFQKALVPEDAWCTSWAKKG